MKPENVGWFVCEKCTTELPCKEHVGIKTVELVVTHSSGMRWDKNGTCEQTVNGSPWERRPECDYGTPMGDLLVQPWIQNALKDPHE